MNWLNAINWMKKNKGMTTDDISKYSGIPKGTLNKLFAGQAEGVGPIPIIRSK